MDDGSATTDFDHIHVTTGIVSAFVSNNRVPISGIADLILSVHASLLALSNPPAPVGDRVVKATAAQVKRSVTDEALISFEDGKPYKTLKRHLRRHGLTPEAYRDKHGLPLDYPITAPGYSARRSELARSIGLGQINANGGRRATEAVGAAPKARRGRPRTKASQKDAGPLAAE